MSSPTPEQQHDIDYLTETVRWVYWPFCPVLRDGQVATCFDAADGQRIVFLENMLTMIEEKIKPSTLQKLEYENSYQMVMDGWAVD